MKKYQEYKPSNVDFIGDIPKHWEVRKLKYCMKDKITDGPHETPKFIEDGIPFLSVDGIQNGELVFENCRKISIEDHINYSKKALLEYDDILLGKAASIGKIARVKVDFEFSIWSPLALIKANKEIVLPTFLEYSLKTKMVQYQIETLATNNTQKNISMADIPKFILTIPPLKEQEKIANFLDTKNKQIEEFIKDKQNQISLLEEQKEAIINKAVTKEYKKIKLKYCVINKAFKSSKYKFKIALENIESKTSKFIKTDDNPFNEAGIEFKKNDVLFGKLRPYLVKVYLAEQSGICVSEFLVLESIENITYSKFLKYLMLSSSFIDVVDGSTYGTKMPRASWDFIGNLKIPLPPINEQKQIIKYIENETSKIDEVINQIQKEIDLIQEYKISLISEVVTGQIKVCDE